MSVVVRDLEGQVAIVTGGGSGIGAEAARRLAAAGASVAVAARKVERLAAVAAEITGDGQTCIAIPTDVRIDDDVNRLVEQTVAAFGRIDIVVNNAGGSYRSALEDLTIERWDNIFALNTRGPYLLTQAAGAHMLSQGRGIFVNISSVAGVSGSIGNSAYSCAKSALQMLTRVTALEWGPRGIRANCIAAGPVASEGAIRSWTCAGLLDKNLKEAGSPADIANGILYLSTEASSFMNGETIVLSGGRR